MAARGHTPKTKLDPEEKLTAAYMHIVRGVEQHILADIYRVNIGRVNEAIQAIRAAIREEREDEI